MLNFVNKKSSTEMNAKMRWITFAPCSPSSFSSLLTSRSFPLSFSRSLCPCFHRKVSRNRHQKINWNGPSTIEMLSPRSFVCPGTFAFVLWLHATSPSRLPSLLPAMWKVSKDENTPRQLTLPRPKSTYSMFELGRLAERVERSDGVISAEVLAEARKHVDRDINADGFRGLVKSLHEGYERSSAAQRLKGAMSLVNMIWIVSIFGLTITLRPALSVAFDVILRRIWTWFVSNVVPVLLKLHRIGVFEAFSYVMCLALVAQAARYLQDMPKDGPGSYFAFTAAALSMLAFSYTISVHNSPKLHQMPFLIEDSHSSRISLSSITYYLFATSVFAPLAITHDSKLLGFFAVLGVLFSIGFIFFSTGLWHKNGFNFEVALLRTIVSVGFLVCAFVGAKLTGVNNRLFPGPFEPGVMILGNSTCFLALLILSSKYGNENAVISYLGAQIAMLLGLGAALGVGNLAGMQAMNNTVATFGVLYCLQKILELPWQQWGIVGYFAGFLCLFSISAFLRTNPGSLRHIFSRFMNK